MNGPYKGTTRKIVFAFDVGTTQTGISYCVLEPGEIPQKRSMHKFPGQEYTIGSHKIPTVMYYDKEGKMVSAGAESFADDVIEKAEEEGWMKVQWFKLRLRPKDINFDFNNADLGPLPPGKTIDDILADFYGYLLQCCEYFIKEVHPTYASSWDDLLLSAEFVLCHPNGWKGAQQGRMRQAAIKAYLVPDSVDGRNRIQFVSEGEASLHYCIEENHLDLKDEGLIVADLGGGTLDFSAYKVESRNPLTIHESARAQCVLEGSEIITKRAKNYLTGRLKGSKYESEEVIDEIVKAFDSRSKRIFRMKTETLYLPFGMVSMRDPKFDIVGGKLKLSGNEVAKFFEPSIAATEKLIIKSILASPVKISAVYIVGGLSGSTYVRSELSRLFEDADLEIRAPSDTSVKAAALGALGFHLDHHVKARTAKYDYGLPCNTTYDMHNPEHEIRKANCFDVLSGQTYISGLFDTILSKGTVVQENTTLSCSYFDEIKSQEVASFKFEKTINAYIGPKKFINWVDEIEHENELQTACVIKGDLSALRSTVVKSKDKNGILYQKIVYDIVLWFGGSELKAQLRWLENGVEKWSPVSIVYDDEFVPEQISEQKLYTS